MIGAERDSIGGVGCDFIQPYIRSGERHWGRCLDGDLRLPGSAQIRGNHWHFAMQIFVWAMTQWVLHAPTAVRCRTLPPASAEEESKTEHPITQLPRRTLLSSHRRIYAEMNGYCSQPINQHVSVPPALYSAQTDSPTCPLCQNKSGGFWVWV